MGRTSLGLSGGKLSLSAKWLGITLVCVGMASCATTEAPKKKPRSKEYFSEKEYGVKASPRVVEAGKPVPKGGGRFMVGQPYQVKGKTYVPKEDPNYNKKGLASWYGAAFHGRFTANGEVYDSEHLSAAHPTFPLPSYARVTNLDNGTSVIVRVNDRGPYHPGRIIDVSDKTAELLDMKRIGTAHVNVQYVGRARMDGRDMPFLMASYIRKGDRLPSIQPEGQIATGVMVASNQPLGDQLQSYGSAMPTPVALAGRTPSGPAPAPAATQAFQAFEQFAALPQIGPLPSERPMAGDRQPRAVAPVYAESAPAKSKAMATYAEPTNARATVAYAEPTRAKAPQVMFGNMILEAPRPAQKPVR
ncbi:septal ring lytic transglycosylase RlpA family protein [Neorhizobium sp. Rsf11]|uniref:Endolytic peptidoglycan transglycosylase RlpA n=1 Tax=Neorhizobium phenanthreniclasticum TaxID=3157917 RepID=A0ABV0M1A4_9HYPH